MSHFTEFVTSLWLGIGSLFRPVTQRSPQLPMKVKKKHSKEQIVKYRPFLNAHAETIHTSIDIDRIGNGIGMGTIGEVYEGFKGSKQYALKVQPVIDADKALNELRLVKHLQHKNVVKLFNFVFVGDGVNIEHSVIKFEYLNATLEEVLNTVDFLTLAESLNLGKKLGFAVAWIHQRLVAHHKINSRNIMCNINSTDERELQLRKVTYKIIDFGGAIKYDTEHAMEQNFDLQTDYYCAPEKLAKKPYKPFFSDPFSVGVTLLEARLKSSQLAGCKAGTRTFATACDTWVELLECADDEASKNDIKYFTTVRTLLSEDPSERASIGEFNSEIRLLKV